MAHIDISGTDQAIELHIIRLMQETMAQKHPDVYCRVHMVVDRVMLREVLQHAKGNQLQAAKLLGISPTTLRFKARSLGLVVEKQVKRSP